SAGEKHALTPNSAAICSRTLSISRAAPRPFRTTSAPARASAWAMPSPMPLVEPVTSATLPARTRPAGVVSSLIGTFMANAPVSGSPDAQAPRYEHCGRRLSGAEMPAGFRHDTLLLLPAGCHFMARWVRFRTNPAGSRSMEMHQVRYFLAVAQLLNFTRAAEECNVTQPSLTRAIRQLEEELGGDLFRRERPHAMLTPLGERMYPLLKQCYDSAQSARALAAMIKDGEVGSLKLAVSGSIELGLILAHVNELRKNFSEIELKILRGTGPQVVEYLKSGEAELAVGTSIGE